MYLMPSTVEVTKAFEQIRDAAFHLLRQQAGVDPHHGGDGNHDIREDIGRHVEDRHPPKSTMRIDMTTKVYGLRKAIATICFMLRLLRSWPAFATIPRRIVRAVGLHAIATW